MYRAKNGGKARHEIFDETMNTRALERLELESDLRRAVDNGEIYVHYQPKSAVETGELRGLEALARWDHPRLGLVPPAEFIPPAEQMGLIERLGRQVMEEACLQVSDWSEYFPHHPPLLLCVNLSARQFQSTNLVADVHGALQRSGLSPDALALELTEGVILGDTEGEATTLGALKELGVDLVVDDFGTGYSSLAYLKWLPSDMLKVDKSFVEGLVEELGDLAIVTSVVTFAHTFGLKVVAEGVETAGQLASLRQMGCDYAQGYYFGLFARSCG